MLYIIIPLFVLLIGGIIYLTATPGPQAPKFARLGEIAFFCGLFWLVEMFAHHVVKF